MEAHKNRKYWGWGYTNVELPAGHLEKILQLISFGLGIKTDKKLVPKPIDDIKISAPNFDLPSEIKVFCSSDHFERIFHTYGQSFRDVWRSLHGRYDHVPDFVAYPTKESHIQELYDHAAASNIGLVIFGGGTSVVGGVELPKKSNKKGFISVDVSGMSNVLDINETDLTVRVQAGCLGPQLERELKERGLVLRHYPQSFEFSTVGGWIATRAGGHFATVFTQIDHFVKNIRMVSPNGTITTRDLPNSGAGPNENRYFCGMEGIFGIITEATLKVQRIPKYKSSRTILFKSFKDGVEACKQLAQSQLHPVNARLVDPIEAMANGLGDGMHTVLILGYESPVHPVNAWMEAGLKICEASGGTYKKTDEEKQDSKANDWKRSFLLAPYLRDELIRSGLVVETFETCTSWSNFHSFHEAITKNVQQAISEHCGKGMVTCRFTHMYPDGPAPYYTVIARGEAGKEFEQWNAIKEAASKTIIENGGTITHHHAVGRDHQPYFAVEQDSRFQDVLRTIKKDLDPDGLLNEGVLIP